MKKNLWKYVSMILIVIFAIAGVGLMAYSSQQYESRISDRYDQGLRDGFSVGVMETFKKAYENGAVSLAINESVWSLLSIDGCKAAIEDGVI